MDNKPEFLVRLEEERDQLSDRVKKLEKSMTDKNFKGIVGDLQYKLLKEQLSHMIGYLECIKERLKYLNGDY